MSELAVETIQIDFERQKKAKEYARLSRWLMLLDLVISALFGFAWLAFGWSLRLRQALEGVTTNDWLLVALFALGFGGSFFVLGLPLDYYRGFVLPHRYGQSNQTRSGWISDQVKGILLGTALGLPVLEIVYLILRRYPDTWWLWAAGFMLVLNVLMTNLAPVLIMPIFYKFKPLGEEHADLAERLIRLAERAGTQVQGVYKFDMSRRTKSANAALTGLGSTRRILLGDTLISEFTPDEIETVLAHELGHHVHKDIPVGILVGTAITLIGFFLAGQALAWGIELFGFRSPADPAAMPLFALLLGVYGLVTMPVENAYSRWRERRADDYALQATRKGPAYASALARLANQNLADADPEPWVEWLLYSHPALGKRIQKAQSWES